MKELTKIFENSIGNEGNKVEFGLINSGDKYSSPLIQSERDDCSMSGYDGCAQRVSSGYNNSVHDDDGSLCQRVDMGHHNHNLSENAEQRIRKLRPELTTRKSIDTDYDGPACRLRSMGKVEVTKRHKTYARGIVMDCCVWRQ